MAELTAHQEMAVKARGRSLLVSAAAGSGKTRVLTERLMSYLCDPDAPKDIDSFLVITYTRAAANELRTRISDMLSERIAAEPGNRRLRRQQALCYSAHIGTIHSFCAALLREKAHLIGLSPDFRVINEERADEIKARVLERLLDAEYAAIAENSAFSGLVDTVGAGRDDKRLADVLLTLQIKMRSHLSPGNWVSEQIAALDIEGLSDASETVWGAALIEDARSRTAYWAGRMESIVSELAGSEAGIVILERYGESFAQTIEAMRSLLNALDEGWDAAADALPIPFPNLKALRKSPDAALSDRAKAVREACKKAMGGLNFSRTSAEFFSETRKTAPVAAELLRLALRFDGGFTREKERLNFLDFSDLEHLALELLCDSLTGEPTETALELQHRFTEIMVDEYQDVSRVQDAIIKALSRPEGNLFLVGDVKQSIYGFRLAEPEVFLERYRAAADSNSSGLVLLRENFRSRRPIIDAVNHVFAHIMSRELGGLEYDDAAGLRYGASYPEEGEVPVTFDVIEAPAASEDGESIDKTELEAGHIADEIQRLMREGAAVYSDGMKRPLEYGDIALLLRSPSGAGEVFSRVLRERGIPLQSGQAGGFFSSLEISVMVSFMAIIDNPHQDVPLISVLRSPLFSYSADELSHIRAHDREGSFYAAMLKAAESDEKGFIRMLEGLRELSSDIPVSGLLWKIYSETEFFALCSAMEGGETRRRNLTALYNCALEYEEMGYRGLSSFQKYLQRLEQRGEEPGAAAQNSGGVTITSIHKAKGLEYPVVFLADTARRFNKRDARETVLIDPELGLGLNVTDTERGIEYPTLGRLAVSGRIIRSLLSEELRVLYVAMTRAKERLYISCAWKNPDRALSRQAGTDPWELLTASSFSDWLARCAGEGPLRLRIIRQNENSAEVLHETETAVFPEKVENDELAELSERLNFAYPHKGSELPSKLTATEFKGRADEDGLREESQEFLKLRREFRRPELLGVKRPLTAAERGTAFHLVMQLIDYRAAGSAEEIAEEIGRLCDEGRISPEQAEAVEPRQLRRFFASDTGKLILQADEVKREFRFSLLVPASDFYPGAEDEEILLQGMVDICAEKDGALTVVDLKTDNVAESEADERAQYYSSQLRIYAAAMERILKKPVERAIVYFIRTHTAIDIDF